MQWTTTPDAGFTTADPDRRPNAIVEGDFGPQRVSVEAQRRDPGSLLNWMERHIRLRKELPELGFGKLRMLDSGEDAVLGHCCDWRGRTVVLLHNFSPDPLTVTIDLDSKGTLAELTSDQEYDPPGETRSLKLGGYGYRWLRLES
jgi:maltose alpha-D-glucosyltransferase / alpha-amylase